MDEDAHMLCKLTNMMIQWLKSLDCEMKKIGDR